MRPTPLPSPHMRQTVAIVFGSIAASILVTPGGCLAYRLHCGRTIGAHAPPPSLRRENAFMQPIDLAALPREAAPADSTRAYSPALSVYKTPVETVLDVESGAA